VAEEATMLIQVEVDLQEAQVEAVMLELIMVVWEVMELRIRVVEAVEPALTKTMVLIKEEEMVVQV
jgi:hypothetical protein